MSAKSRNHVGALLLYVVTLLTLVTIPAAAAGEWNGVSISALNGITISSWNGTLISTGTVDTTPPTLVSATVNADGVTLTLVFSEAVTQLNSPSVFLSHSTGEAFDMVFNSGDSTTTVLYDLNKTVLSVDTVSIDFVEPNSIQDLAGNNLIVFSGFPVTNNSVQ